MADYLSNIHKQLELVDEVVLLAVEDVVDLVAMEVDHDQPAGLRLLDLFDL